MSGVDVTKVSPQARARRGLARTFQRLELFAELTVREHLVVAHRARHRRLNLFADLLGLGNRPGPGEDERVDRIITTLGLGPVAGQTAAALPLGTGRIVEVARAMAAQPSVLLLDEPSSGLDAVETQQLSDALRQLNEQDGVALLLVEHNVEFVLGLAEHVTVLDFGQVIAAGTPKEIREDEAVQAAYLGVV
jgi:ABC-type branched-subunit amino acid transport system ATPase component